MPPLISLHMATLTLYHMATQTPCHMAILTPVTWLQSLTITCLHSLPITWPFLQMHLSSHGNTDQMSHGYIPHHTATPHHMTTLILHHMATSLASCYMAPSTPHHMATSPVTWLHLLPITKLH